MTRTEFFKRYDEAGGGRDFSEIIADAIGLTDEAPKPEHSPAYLRGRADAEKGDWPGDRAGGVEGHEWRRGWDSWHAEHPKPAPVAVGGTGLTFASLRAANMARLPKFKNRRGEPAHSKPDGSDWCLAQWANAVCGELGEAANIIKKIERGDMTLDEGRQQLADELADVQTYLDILSFRAGIDLGAATTKKFNEVSERVKCDVWLAGSKTQEPPAAAAVEDIGARIAEVNLSVDRQAHCIIWRGYSQNSEKVDTSTSPFSEIRAAVAHNINLGIAEARKAWEAKYKADVAKAVAEEREACAKIALLTCGFGSANGSVAAHVIRARATAEAGKGEV